MATRILQAVGRSQPFVKILPLPVVSNRSPNTSDVEFPQGQLWLDEVPDPSAIWTHTGGGIWVQSGGGGGASVFPADVGSATESGGFLNILGGTGVDTVAAGNTVTINAASEIASSYLNDVGSAVPVGNVLNILGGPGVQTTGVGNTITIDFVGGTGANSFPADAGTANDAGGILNILGGTGIDTVGAGNTITINAAAEIASSYPTDAGTATPVANALNILGGTGIDTSGVGDTVTVSASADIASSYTTDSGTAIPVANVLDVIGSGGITTSGAGNILTITAGPSLASSFDGDSGSAIPVANTLTIAGGTGITTSAAGSTLTVDLDVPVTVPNGGTGDITLTDGGIMLGSGVNPVTVTAQPTDGQLLIGSTGLDPVLSNLVSADSSIVITNGAGTIDLATGSDVADNFPCDIGTGIPVAGVLRLLGTGTVDTSAVGNTITINGTTAPFPWITVVLLTQQLAVNTGYIGNNTSFPIQANIVYTLPVNSVVGDVIRITNLGGDTPKIAQNAGQGIAFTESTTTIGVGGSLTAVEQFSSIHLLCVLDDVLWIVLSHTGNWIIV